MKQKKRFWICLLAVLILVLAAALFFLFFYPALRGENTQPQSSPPNDQTETSPAQSAAPESSSQITPPPLATFDGQSPLSSPLETTDPADLPDPRDAQPAAGSDPDEGNANAQTEVVLDRQAHTYHRPTCPTLSNTSDRVTKREATASGYQACNICKP